MKNYINLPVLVGLMTTFLAFADAYSERYIQINAGAGTYHQGAVVPIGADNIVHWSGLTVTWRLNSNGAGDGLTFSQTQSAVQNAFNSWQNVSTSSISFSYGGSTSNTWANDGQNVNFWAESGDPAFGGIPSFGPGVLAITCITINASQEMQDVDVVFNGRDYVWKVDGTDHDIEAVSAHENGHLIGMHHTEVTGTPTPTMSGSYFGIGARSLEGDDHVGASFLYRGNLIDNETLSGFNYFDWSLTVYYTSLTLTINAGTTLNFVSGTSLTINGKLVADSNDPNQRITFTGATSSPGSWGGIQINSGNSSNVSTLRRCDVKFATTGITITYTGQANNVTIDKCRIYNNSSRGIYVNGNAYSSAYAHPTLSSNHIYNNSGSGITVANYAKPTITGNRIVNNSSYGIEATSSYTGEVSYNYIASNNSNAMIFYGSSHAQVHRNTIRGNRYGVYIFSNSNITAYGGGNAKGRNEITSNTGVGIYANSSSPTFGIASEGNNWIQLNVGYEAQQVGGGYQILAENCYWGGGAPPPSEISGNVDYTPFASTQPNPVGWGQSNFYDPSLRIWREDSIIVAQPVADVQFALYGAAVASQTKVANETSPNWTTDLQAAINAGLSTGDWGPASMLITDLHRELQDAGIPALDFVLVNTYANDSKVAAFIRKMLALVLMEKDLVDNNTSTALAKLAAFRPSNSGNAAEFLANAGLIHLYHRNDVAAAQNVLAQLKTMAQSGDAVAAEHVNVFGRILQDYQTHQATTDLARPMITSPQATAQLPVNMALAQNYPNPFNPETTIRFHLNERRKVLLLIFDLNGKVVRTLVDAELSAGEQELSWDGRDQRGKHLASGVYFYELAAGDKIERKKMMLIR
jgi:hypothetical protein